jgi:glycosyltransferase EpsH
MGGSQKAKVSIVISIYNGERFLTECLDSVLAQTYRNIEVICVDDGSTDSTPDLLDMYARMDNRIKVITQVNGGIGVARNNGGDSATGDYVYHMDADDFIDVGFIEEGVKSSADAQADVVVLGYDIIEHGEYREPGWPIDYRFVPHEPYFKPDSTFLNYCAISIQGAIWNKLYRTSLIRDRVLRFPEIYSYEDIVFNTQALALSGAIAIAPGSERYHYRINHGGNISQTKGGIAKWKETWKGRELLKSSCSERGVWESVKQGAINLCSFGIINQLLTFCNSEDAAAVWDDITNGIWVDYCDGAKPDSYFVSELRMMCNKAMVEKWTIDEAAAILDRGYEDWALTIGRTKVN